MLKTKKLHNTLKPGQWKTRIFSEQLGKGWKPSRVSLVGLRNRPYPLMEVTNDEFGQRLAKDGQGFFIETPFVCRGTPVLWTRQGYVVCIWPIPIHGWKMQVEVYKEVDDDESADTIGGGKTDDSSAGAGDSVVAGRGPAEITLQRHEYRALPESSE